MRICLLYPRWTGAYGLFSILANKASTWPPLNLCYLAAIAEKEGHEVRILDGQAENLDAQELVDQTAAFDPHLIGVTSTTPFHHVVVEMAQHLKARLPRVPIVIGGAHITLTREQGFDAVFEYGFVGEADLSWPQLLRQLSVGGDVRQVPGILHRNDGTVQFTGDAPRVENLDDLPMPARHLLRTDRYRIATIMTMRGCPFNCIFCSTQVFGHRVRKRSPQLVVEEIKSVIRDFGVRHFIFMDDTLTLDRKHILAICDGLQRERVAITFEGATRANLLDEELIARMAETGLIRMGFGLESADETVRRIIKKEVPLESYTEANRLANRYGIETQNACMIGLPGDTKESIRKTLAFLRQARDIKQANLSIAVPYPGTELNEMAKRGDHGLRLIESDFSKFRRYNSAVMQVGDLSPQDLIKLQNDAFVSIYIVPWRWKSVYKKSGLLGLLLTFSRLIRSLIRGKVEFLTNRQLGLR
jgi:radical SAM superfamily enzyme YgiQ (UPF0313 family)